MRRDIISEAVERCLRELYEYVVPNVTWEEFIKENQSYTELYNIWDSFNKAFHYKEENVEEWDRQKKLHPEWENKSISECIGPRPYEFYYLPKEIMKDVCDSYINIYRLDAKQDFLNNISTLKDYCKNPIIDKYIEGENGFPGYRGYDHPDNLEKEIKKYLKENYDLDLEDSGITEICNIFYKFLDMAGNFYNWNRDLNSFNVSVYLGPSPNSNKEAVIKNWKEHRNKDIEINEEEIKKKYYGEDDE